MKIDQEKCGVCLGCATICPEALFYFVQERLAIADGCIDCGSCVTCCPVRAIAFQD